MEPRTDEIRNTSEVEALLVEALEDATDGVARTFGDAGLLTQDRGVVLSFRNGAEFQISIVRSGRVLDAVGCRACGDDLENTPELTAHLVEAHGYDVEDATLAAVDAR